MPRITGFPTLSLTRRDAILLKAAVPATDVVVVRGSEVTTPPAGAVLASYTVPTGRTGHFLGMEVYETEANALDIRWTSGGAARAHRVYVPSGGYFQLWWYYPPTVDAPADAGTAIQVAVVNAGTATGVYRVYMYIGLI